MKTAVLLIVFNRPNLTRITLEAIGKSRPTRLYIAADGPRKDRNADTNLCKQVRAYAENINWPCVVKTLYQDENLGCKLAVSTAINWFFDSEEEGIILEDDTVPNLSFFRFCEELLERYRHDSAIAMIAGSNNFSDGAEFKSSYLYSKYSIIWGWATWRRAWKNYNIEMPNWQEVRKNKRNLNCSYIEFNYWKQKFDDVYCNKINTWDYQWTYENLCRNMKCIIPKNNMIKNIGLGADGTHTINSSFKQIIAKEMHFPLSHEIDIIGNKIIDKKINMKIFGINHSQFIISNIKRIIKYLIINIK